MSNKVVDVSTAYVRETDDTKREDSFLCGLSRRWFAIRWQLARVVFARPVPYLTSKFEFKLGDILVTVPVSVAMLVYNALLCQQQDVKASGGVPSLALILVFGFSIRNNSPLLSVTGLPFERALLYHKWFAWVAVLTGALHGLAYYWSDAGLRRRRRLERLENNESSEDDRATSGMILLGCMTALVLFSLPPIRRRYFEAFVRFHWILFIGVIVFAIIHGAGGVLVGAIPWLIDVLFRFAYRLRRYSRDIGVLAPQQVKLTRVCEDLVRVQFPKVNAESSATFNYEVGQYIFLCFPQISRLEWHPFTISSTPYDSMVTVYIKVLGDWTKKLANELLNDPHAVTTMKTLVDGPYGAPSIEWNNPAVYKHFVMFSGGIGATPMMSFANHLYAQGTRTQNPRPVSKVWFVWSVRERELVDTLMLQGSDPSNEHNWLPNGLHAFSQPVARENTFLCDIFLTKSARDPNHIVDQQLSSHLYYKQRPNIQETLRVVGLEATQQRQSNQPPPRVAVLVCGPGPLVEDVLTQSRRLSKELHIQFDVHQETFLF